MRALIMQLMSDGRREKVCRPDWAEPAAPGPGQVKTRTLFSGVTNGTERNGLLRGNYSMPDEALPAGYGYQNVGRVVEVGPDVDGLAVGDVLFMGDDHHEFVLAHQDGLLIKLPETIDLRHAALFGVASVAMHDVRRAETKLGDRVLVIGAGPIGQFTAQAARAAGAHVTAVDLDARRLAVAPECGAHHTIQVAGDATWEGPIRDAGPFDIVFEDSGADVLGHVIGSGWGSALVRHRGVVMIIAGRDTVAYSFNAGQGTEVAVLHAGHFDNSDLAEVTRLVADGVLRVAPILQDVAKPEQAKDIYDTLRDDPNKLLGTVFDWQ